MRTRPTDRSFGNVRGNIVARIFPILLLGAVASGFANAHAAVFEITGGEPNLVKFVSKAPMETVEGTTRQVTGAIEFDPEVLGDTARVLVQVDLASLDTGIGLRNQHMRENHLETERFPYAVFRGAGIESGGPTSLRPGETASVELIGTFEVHGVTRPLRVPARVTLAQAADGRRSLRINAEFVVKLSDYEISRPQFLVMKLDELQRITVDLLAVESASGGADAPR